jgi:sulfur transfer complex TusBCD TusB component (DsrH family)
MLILFLGSDYLSIKPLLGKHYAEGNTVGEGSAGKSAAGKHHAIIVGQQGVFQLHNILNDLHDRDDASIHVIKRDLQGTGLLSTFEKHDRVTIIEFEEFVTLATQHVPCITIQ